MSKAEKDALNDLKARVSDFWLAEILLKKELKKIT